MINPERRNEMKEDLNRFDKMAEQVFQQMDFMSLKQQEMMLHVLWFTAQPCRKLLIHCSW